MIVSEFKQGTEDWLIERSSIPSASNFAKILTTKGAASTMAGTYMNQLLAEWYVGGPVDVEEGSFWMNRGNELEPEARGIYEIISNNSTKQVGFCFKDEKKMVGCSPDSLIGDDGLLELKCPKASTMVSYILGRRLPLKYFQQVHGQIWITGRQWCDFMAYHPEFEPFMIRVERDEEFIGHLEKRIGDFVHAMVDKRVVLFNSI